MIDALVDLSWRAYPASAMMALGVLLAARGARMSWRGLAMPFAEPTRMQVFVRGFRIAVVGVVLVDLGAAWNWQQLWLLVLALVFGGEELLESSTHLSILRGTLLKGWRRRRADGE